MDANAIYAANKKRSFENGTMSDAEAKQYIMDNPGSNANTDPMTAYTNSKLALEKQKFDQEQAKAASLKSQGLNPDGSPIRKDFQTIANPDGTLQDAYKIKDWQNINADTSAMDLLKKDAVRSAGTDSAWAQLERQKQKINEQNSMDTSSKAGANAYLSAQSNLAQTGGLSGAARERLATSNMRSTADNIAAVKRQSLLDQLGISSQDETNRLSGLNAFQNMANQQTQFQFQNQEDANKVAGVNLQNQLQELNAKRGWDTDTYKEQMSKWAAGKTADAQAAAAGGGGGKK